MKRILVETNWIVAAFAPEPFRVDAALQLLDAAERGEIILHVPAVCLREGERSIREKFKPKTKDLGSFRRAALERGDISSREDATIQRFLTKFEGAVRRDLAALSATLDELRRRKNVEVFSLTDKALDRCLALRSVQGLRPFDEAILAAVLERCVGLSTDAPDDELSFVTLDEAPLQQARTQNRSRKAV